MMAHKKKKENSKTRQTWVGFYPRKTKSLAEKEKADLRKQKQKGWTKYEE